MLFLVRHKREELRRTRIPLKLGEEPERVVVELSKDVLNNLALSVCLCRFIRDCATPKL